MSGRKIQDFTIRPPLSTQSHGHVPKIRDGVFSMPGLSDDERRELWHMLLVDMNSLGRASDVTGNHCPLLEDVEFPKSANDHLSDTLHRRV